MRKLFLAFTFCVLMVGSLYGDVSIDKKHRIANRAPGYCCWCCLETLGRNQGIHILENLTDNRAKDPDHVYKVQVDGNDYMITEPKNAGSVSSVREKLDSLKVKYKITFNDEKHLKEASDKNGCVIFMKPNSLMPGPHAVILTDFNDKTFKYIDPNTQSYWQGTREWFDIYWDHVAISLE